MPGVGVGIIILNELKQVLLLLRNEDQVLADSDMHLEGTWTLPAGKVHMYETLYDAAVRKVLEEVNLEVSDLELVSLADDINEYAHFVTAGFIAHEYSGEVSLGETEEHIDYNWFDLSNLPVNLCDPSQKIIDNYVKKIVYREE